MASSIAPSAAYCACADNSMFRTIRVSFRTEVETPNATILSKATIHSTLTKATPSLRDLTRYKQIEEKLRATQTCGDSMPPGGSQTISDPLIQVVVDWINMGAPND